jgi:hypothetical protein
MMPTSIPIDMTPEASKRIAELRIQPDVDRMIDHAVNTVAGIRRVEITLEPENEMYDGPYLSASAYRDLDLWTEVNAEVDRFEDWKINTFSPDVLWHFSLHIRPDWPNAG